MNINQIHDYIYNNDRLKVHSDFVKSYQIVEQDFALINYEENGATYDIYSQILGDYAIALTETADYKKSQQITQKALEMLEKNPRLKYEDIYSSDFFKALLFNRAKNNYYLKNYKSATTDLKNLVNRYPANTNFKLWLVQTRNIKFKWLKYYAWSTAGILLIVQAFTTNKILNDTLLITATLLCVIAIAFEVLLFKSKNAS